MAAHFQYSERQMQRIIRQTTGLGFSENIRILCMKKAAGLLETTSQPAAKIAEMPGYCDVHNFRQAFKQHYGMTPSGTTTCPLPFRN